MLIKEHVLDANVTSRMFISRKLRLKLACTNTHPVGPLLNYNSFYWYFHMRIIMQMQPRGYDINVFIFYEQ
jgi:hypothetical protein